MPLFSVALWIKICNKITIRKMRSKMHQRFKKILFFKKEDQSIYFFQRLYMVNRKKIIFYFYIMSNKQSKWKLLNKGRSRKSEHSHQKSEKYAPKKSAYEAEEFLFSNTRNFSGLRLRNFGKKESNNIQKWAAKFNLEFKKIWQQIFHTSLKQRQLDEVLKSYLSVLQKVERKFDEEKSKILELLNQQYNVIEKGKQYLQKKLSLMQKSKTSPTQFVPSDSIINKISFDESAKNQKEIGLKKKCYSENKLNINSFQIEYNPEKSDIYSPRINQCSSPQKDFSKLFSTISLIKEDLFFLSQNTIQKNSSSSTVNQKNINETKLSLNQYYS